VSRSWKDGALDGPRSPKYTRTKFRYKPEKEQEVSDTVKVFVIINEWTDNTNDTSSEVTGGKWFASEDEAWDALDLIAQAHNVELDPDETSLQLEDHKSGLQSEEYRIEELTHG
jgi:hypothetical protein